MLSESFCAAARAMMSVLPPGVNGTTMRTGFDGYVSADSFGYRLRASLRYPNVAEGLDLMPSVVFGHSYGEYPAMVATGAWSVATGMRATHGRCRALDALGAPRGKLVSTSASLDQIQGVIRSFAGRGFVAPANFTSPEQTVLAVETALVQEVADAI